MDFSTDDVTLDARLLLALRAQFEEARAATQALLEMTAHLDPEQPHQQVPMMLYNQACDWVERTLGPASVRRAGRAIAAEIYAWMRWDGTLEDHPTPQQVLSGLKSAMDVMVQDPRGRGWQLVEVYSGEIRLRRTQTFNCLLQEGLLKALVERTGAQLVQVEHVRCTRRGDAFCEYDVRWAEHGMLAIQRHNAG